MKKALSFLLIALCLTLSACAGGDLLSEERRMPVQDYIRQIERDMGEIALRIFDRTLQGVEPRAREIAHMSSALAHDLETTRQRDYASDMVSFAQSLATNASFNRFEAAEADFINLRQVLEDLKRDLNN